MKKLIMALGAVAATTALNAATVQWNSGAITLVNGSEAAKDNVTAYIWESLSSDIYDQVKAGTLNVVTEFKKSGYGSDRDWSSDVCSSDLETLQKEVKSRLLERLTRQRQTAYMRLCSMSIIRQLVTSSIRLTMPILAMLERQV